MAVIGCGYWGRNLVRNFAELGALAAVADAREGAARELGERHAVPAVTADAALGDPAIAAVAIATPAATHAELALRALAAGKDVFVEKPLALDLADAEQVAREAAARGRVAMVGHLLQYHPAFVELRRIAADGTLGRLRYIYSNRVNLGRFRREENVFWSFAPHDVSMILALAGEEPEWVDAVGACYLHDRVADVTTTQMRFPSGVHAHIFVSWLHPFKEQRLVVVGDKGMAVFDDGQPWATKLVVYAHEVRWRNGMPEADRAEAIPIALEPSEPLRNECSHFLGAVARRHAPRTDAAEGVRVLRVLAAAEAAARGRLSGAAPAAAATPGEGVRVDPTATVDPGCTLGAGTRIWHYSHILAGSRLGKGCSVGQNVMIGPNVTVGDGCKIQNNVSLYEGVELEDGVFCGPSCVFTNVKNPRAEVSRRGEFLRTVVRRGATIGANATIVCGVELGAYCLIGAGAVVSRDVPPHALMVGAPARQVGWVSHAGERLGDDLTCPRTGRRYEVTAEGRLVERPGDAERAAA